ncbi:MAG TPA: L,D-transpeptidase [Ktedonobacterales bacterium]|nr:L,D-transpeptidase [Ktedonobacterales bacterium]
MATARPSNNPGSGSSPIALPPGPLPYGSVPNISGQLILVSLSQQWLFAYQDHTLIFRTPVTTGMPELPTPTGTYHVRWHEQNITFYSPWPQGSPYYYSPEHINYAMYYADYGYYIHDAPWRETFGPGTNYPHTEPDGQVVTGSHGCTNVPTKAMSWLYSWAHDGATIVIYGQAPVPPPATAIPTQAQTQPTPTMTPAPAPTATATPASQPTAMP